MAVPEIPVPPRGKRRAGTGLPDNGGVESFAGIAGLTWHLEAVCMHRPMLRYAQADQRSGGSQQPPSCPEARASGHPPPEGEAKHCIARGDGCAGAQGSRAASTRLTLAGCGVARPVGRGIASAVGLPATEAEGSHRPSGCPQLRPRDRIGRQVARNCGSCDTSAVGMPVRYCWNPTTGWGVMLRNHAALAQAPEHPVATVDLFAGQVVVPQHMEFVSTHRAGGRLARLLPVTSEAVFAAPGHDSPL